MFYYRRNRKQRKKFQKHLQVGKSNILSSLVFLDDNNEIVDASYFENGNINDLTKNSFIFLLGTKEFANLYKFVGNNIVINYNIRCDGAKLQYKFDMVAGNYVYRDLNTGEIIISEKDFE